MENRQVWAIARAIQARKMNPEAKKTLTEEELRVRELAKKKAQREAAKALKEEERAQAKAEKKALVEAKRAEKKAMKEAEKAAQPPKRRGRPPKVKPAPDVPQEALPVYGRLEELKKMADDVYASLGAGHLESIYHSAMAVELRLAGLPYESEQVMPVTHKGHYVGTVRADIILAKECVLEFKISGKLDEAKQQARQYMKLQNIPFGFVVKFPKADGGAIEFVDARLADD